MDHFAVAAAGLLAELAVLLKDYQVYPVLVGEGLCHCQTDHPGADDDNFGLFHKKEECAMKDLNLQPTD